ncbi:MAG: hydrolase, partial [Alphaproteobacteria bacterium]|nr:hydrolase [Alphaproteobacteria bacterium]
MRSLIDVAHEKGVPVIYSTSIRRADDWDDGSWVWKNSRSGEPPSPVRTDIHQYDIVAEIAPSSRDIV